MKIQVILASIRPGRVGERVATWVTEAAQARPDFEVELVDLADYQLPHFNEAQSPRFNAHRRPEPAVKRWLDKLGQADGYIFVTPEYNHAFPGILKDGLDFTDFQLAKKPAAIVSYGVVGGARAAEQLKLVLVEAKAAIVPEAVALAGPESALDKLGRLQPGAERYASGLTKTLEQLDWWTAALKTARDRTLAAAA